ncbi:MAG: PaaI family thioesterase [Desulfarculus sp.]|nr:MAG: PaaI family thioesterase [Desulfarculus sp.]
MPQNWQPVNPDFADRVRRSFARQGFMALLGAELTRVEPGLVEIQAGYRLELTQQHGYFHAGVAGTLADNCGGYAAFTLMPADASVLTVEYKLNLLAPGKGQRLMAQGRVLRPGRSLTVCRTEVWAVDGGQKTLCAAGQMTLMTLAGKSDRPPA